MIPLFILSMLSATIDILKIDWVVVKHKTPIKKKQLELIVDGLAVFIFAALTVYSGYLTVWGQVLVLAMILIALANVGIVCAALIAARRKKL